MKKKLIIGALALTSILAFAQEREDSSTSETGKRRFWGWGSATPEYVDNCSSANTGQQPDGGSMCTCTAHYTYYVMWIGFDHAEQITVPC